MYKTILCAIEASPEGEEVLAKAAKLAALYGSKLLVIHVLQYSILPKDYQKALKKEVAPKVHEILKSVGVPLKNCVIKTGKPYSRICREAEKRNADLIILGTHSKKGVRNMIGSTANGVCNYAKCDVTLFRIC